MKIENNSIKDQDDYLDAWEQMLQEIDQKYGLGYSWPFDLLGRHYFNIHALRISREEDMAFREAHSRLVSLLHSIRDRISKRPEVMEFLGIPESLHTACSRIILPHLTAVGRFDWVVGKDGFPKMLEINSETPSGIIEAVFVQPMVAEKHFPHLVNPNADLWSELQKSMQQSFLGQGGCHDSTVALVGVVEDDTLEESYAISEDLSTLLAMQKIAKFPASKVLLGDVRKIAIEGTKLYLDGHPVDFLHSLYTVERLATDWHGDDFVRILDAGHVKMLNPPDTLLIHAKSISALAWILAEHRQLDPADEETVRRHIPYTLLEPDFFYGEKVIIKPLHTREGSGIKYEECLNTDYSFLENVVFQEYVDSIKLEFPVMYNGRVRSEQLYTTIGTFCVNDKMAGYYSRFGGRIINAKRVCWAPTLIQNPIQ